VMNYIRVSRCLRRFLFSWIGLTNKEPPLRVLHSEPVPMSTCGEVLTP
jgi:hypothetical protein